MADIFREVEDDIRRDNAKQLWDKYGIYLIGTAVAIVVATSAVVGWRAYATSTAEDAALAFIEAERAASAEGADAPAIFSALAEASPSGYAALARLREAAAFTAAGDNAGAVRAYEALAADASAQSILRDLAQVKAGALLVGEASYDDLATRLVPLTDEAAPWRNPAREVLGLASYREKNYDRAYGLFQEIVNDPTATPGVRDRAHVMIALIEPHVSRAAPVETAPEAVPEIAPETKPETEAVTEPEAGEAE
ncbi:MAG: tetratricopeptide repeat protein [Parvibaculum sp.]